MPRGQEYLNIKGLQRFVPRNHTLPHNPVSWTTQIAVVYNEFLADYMPGRPSQFVWIEERALNAFADVFNGEAIIGINIGTLEVLLDFFAAAMCEPKILPHIGNSTVEEAYWEELQVSPDGIPHENEEFVNVPRREPRDPDRLKFAISLVLLALDFTFLHEFSHIISGHIEFRRAELRLRSPLRARPIGFTDKRFLRLRQAMELDADSYALNMLTVNFLSEGLSLTELDGGVPRNDRCDRYHLLSLALMGYICLTAPETFGTSFRHRSHPHPILRMLFTVDAIYPLLDDAVRDEFREIFYTSVETLSDIWQALEIGNVNADSNFIGFLDQAEALDAERYKLASIHRELLVRLAPYDTRPNG